MTEQEKEVLGIWKVNLRSEANFHFVPHLGEMRLPDFLTVNDILERIYESGVTNGKRRGRTELANEFKSLLNIDTEDE